MTSSVPLSREYNKTHPWLTFSVDLKKAPPHLWILLGECQSKCEHIAGVALRQSIAQQLYLLYLAKGVSATTAIEGNTLSENQVLAHLKGQLTLPLSQQYLKQEIDNILNGCNLILDDIKRGKQHSLTTDRIKELNRIVLDNLTLESHVFPGQIRNYSVGVARYRGAPAQDCEHLLDRLCEWLDSPDLSPSQDFVIGLAALKAVIAHLYLAWIHPFGDGNGRTARLIEFQILICSGVPAPAAHLLSNHYNQTRTEYYRQLDYASSSGGDVMPFITYAIQGFVDGLRSQLEYIKQQQLNVAWQNYVHDVFKDKSSVSAIRQRRLVLDLSEQTGAVPFSGLVEISPRIAKAYANKTNRTLTRDLNRLLEMNLIVKEDNRYRANKELILAFLPVKASL